MIKVGKDPVCGMEVDEKKAAAKSEHMGKPFLGIGIAIAAMDQARKRVSQGLSREE